MLPLLLALAAAPHREAVGQFGRWGAFREGGACFALAEPVTFRDDALRPYALVARGGLRLRLSAPAKAGSIVLSVGGTRFPLDAHDRDATAGDPRRIVAAIRRSRLMRVSARDARGRAFNDDYPLRGAPSAIDAAAMACLR